MLVLESWPAKETSVQDSLESYGTSRADDGVAWLSTSMALGRRN